MPNESNVIVRQMLTHDVQAVSNIEKKVNKSPWPQDLFNGELRMATDSRLWLIAERQELVVGFIGVMFADNEATILNLGVDNRYQKKGIGSKLISEAIKRIKHKFDVLFLEVRTSNEKAINVYKKHGFEIKGIRERYYPDSEDALTMAIQL